AGAAPDGCARRRRAGAGRRGNPDTASASEPVLTRAAFAFCAANAKHAGKTGRNGPVAGQNSMSVIDRIVSEAVYLNAAVRMLRRVTPIARRKDVTFPDAVEQW